MQTRALQFEKESPFCTEAMRFRAGQDKALFKDPPVVHLSCLSAVVGNCKFCGKFLTSGAIADGIPHALVTNFPRWLLGGLSKDEKSGGPERNNFPGLVGGGGRDSHQNGGGGTHHGIVQVKNSWVYQRQKAVGIRDFSLRLGESLRLGVTHFQQGFLSFDSRVVVINNQNK